MLYNIGMLQLLFALALTAAAPAGYAEEPAIGARLAASPLVVDGFALDTESLAAFYRLRGFAPVWHNDAARADQALEFLAKSDRDGLHPPDYAIVPLARRLVSPLRAAVDTELLLTHSLLHYVTDMKVGRAAPSRKNPKFYVYPRSLDAPALLAASLTAPSLPAALEALAPQYPEYRRLREALAQYRAIAAAGGYTRVAAGAPLKHGDRGLRVAALRTRLAEEGYLAAATSDAFDDATVEALKRFQANHGLAQDGAAGPRTLRRLNESTAHHIGDLELNLERWRWLPDDLGRRHIRVNIAGYAVRAYADGREVLRMRAVVGKPARMTPEFSSVLTDVIFQPHWYVPERIAREDLLPKLRANPRYLEDEGFTVLARDSHGNLVAGEPPADWNGLSDQAPFPYVLRQAAGPANALGPVRYSIRNDWDIYMHGTPAKRLFAELERAFSSGCIRLERPLDLAYFVFETMPEYDRARVAELYYRDVSAPVAPPLRVALNEPIPVHIVYWTAWADEDGSVHFVDDVYGRDAELARALKH